MVQIALVLGAVVTLGLLWYGRSRCRPSIPWANPVAGADATAPDTAPDAAAGPVAGPGAETIDLVVERPVDTTWTALDDAQLERFLDPRRPGPRSTGSTTTRPHPRV